MESRHFLMYIFLQYIRLSDSTSVDKLWFMMKHYWSLKPPTLILSIIGGNTDLQLDMDVKKSLEGGLAKVCVLLF